MLQRVLATQAADMVRFCAGVRRRCRRTARASACKLGPGRRDRQAHATRAYVSRRSPDWIKLKCGQRQEFVIGGYTDPQGLAHRRRLAAAGRARQGRRAALRGQRRHRLQRASAARPARPSSRRCATDASPFAAAPRSGERRRHWVKPELVARSDLRRMDARRPHPPSGVPGPAQRQAGQRHHARAAPARASTARRRAPATEPSRASAAPLPATLKRHATPTA